MICLNCKKEIDNPKFCTSSCAASYNNRIAIKRKLQNTCSCGALIRSNVKMCKACFERTRTKTTMGLTVGELKELYKDKRYTSLAAKIRGYAKTIYENSEKQKYCVNCGYDRHYEVCHIKAVKNFLDNSTMAEVHSLDNLIALCPNCHWEFDQGMLDISRFDS